MRELSKPARVRKAAASTKAAAADPVGPELVGVREAARQLGTAASQVSRQVKAGIIPNHGAPDQPLVDVEEARQARDIGLDPSKRRGPGAAPSAQRNNETYQAARARREAAAAQMAEIDLALRKGELCQVDAMTRKWAAELDNLIAATERFILDLPDKLGLGHAAVDICRAEWRAFRRRQADQASAMIDQASG